jgi:colicin import membrane protein
MYAHASQLNAQEKLISGAVAAGMHLLFLALLVFGVNWQKHIEPPVNMVDLWSPPAPVAEAPPAPPPEPAPPPPPQEVKPEPKLRTPAPVKAVPKPEAVKPDIAFKDKKDKEREKEHEKDREKEKRAEEKKQQDARKKEQEAQQAQAAEAQRVANEQAEAQRRVAEQAVAAQVRLIDEYKSRIQAQIYKTMQPFDDLPKDAFAEIEITVLPDGNVLSTVVKKNSASARFNEAVERAVLKAQPLPVPKGKDAALFADNFRRMTLVFRPKQ